MRRQEKTRDQKTRRGYTEANFDGGIPDRKEQTAHACSSTRLQMFLLKDLE